MLDSLLQLFHCCQFFPVPGAGGGATVIVAHGDNISVELVGVDKELQLKIRSAVLPPKKVSQPR